MIIDGIVVKVKCDRCGKFHATKFWGFDSANIMSKKDGWYVNEKNNFHICKECLTDIK